MDPKKIFLCTDNPEIKENLIDTFKESDKTIEVHTLSDIELTLETKNLDTREKQLADPYQYTDTFLMKCMSILSDRDLLKDYDYVITICETLVPDYLGGFIEYVPLRPSAILDEMKDCEPEYRTAIRAYYISYCNLKDKGDIGTNSQNVLRRTKVGEVGDVLSTISEEDKTKTDSISVINLSYSSIFSPYKNYKNLLSMKWVQIL